MVLKRVVSLFLWTSHQYTVYQVSSICQIGDSVPGWEVCHVQVIPGFTESLLRMPAVHIFLPRRTGEGVVRGHFTLNDIKKLGRSHPDRSFSAAFQWM